MVNNNKFYTLTNEPTTWFYYFDNNYNEIRRCESDGRGMRVGSEVLRLGFPFMSFPSFVEGIVVRSLRRVFRFRWSENRCLWWSLQDYWWSLGRSLVWFQGAGIQPSSSPSPSSSPWPLEQPCRVSRLDLCQEEEGECSLEYTRNRRSEILDCAE